MPIPRAFRTWRAYRPVLEAALLLTLLLRVVHLPLLLGD
jgi:hypothetical protein